MVANFIQSYKVMYKDENNAWRYYTLSGASAPKVLDVFIYLFLQRIISRHLSHNLGVKFSYSVDKSFYGNTHGDRDSIVPASKYLVGWF